MEPAEVVELDPFDIYDVEAGRLDRFFAGAGEDVWQRPSRCEGWSVRDVLGHLAGEEGYNHACLDGTLREMYAELVRQGVATDMDSFHEWCVEQRRGLPVSDVIAEWREANGLTRRRMRERGWDGTLLTSVGPYPVGLQTLHYDSELATHADDIGVPVEDGEEPGRTAWRAGVGLFALSEQDRPVEVAALPEGFRVRSRGLTAELPARDFVEATVARLPGDYPIHPWLRRVLACLA